MGIGAPVEFVSTLEGLANAHHENMAVDVIRAYHFGARFIVEARFGSTYPQLCPVSHHYGPDACLTVQDCDRE